MKRTIFGLVTLIAVCLTVFAVLAVHPLRTVKAHHGCSNRTLLGNYGWTEFGYEPEESPNTFWTETALVNFDGQGNFTGSNVYEVDNGAFYSLSPTSFTSGTYNVNSNCTVSITYTWESNVYTDQGVVVGSEGSEVVASEQGPDTTGHLDIKKISDWE
jgi:hypothetical protein